VFQLLLFLEGLVHMVSLGNRILAELVDDDEYSFFFRRLISVPLSFGQILSAPGIPIKHAYFITGGMACVLTSKRNGMTVSDHVIGREGFVGVPLILECDQLPVASTVVQVAGDAMRTDIALFREAFRKPGKLQSLLHRYVLSHLGHVMQVAACNRLHCIGERLALLLLMTSDRVGDEFRMTHETIAQMLGSRRATVTVEAERFQSKGLVRYRYGHITILNHRGLQDAACECYGVHREDFQP
jgi:CRP-like cAMP-binding protein